MGTNDVVSVKQFAKLAGVKPRAVYRWLRKGLVKPCGVTPSGRTRLRASDAVRHVA